MNECSNSVLNVEYFKWIFNIIKYAPNFFCLFTIILFELFIIILFESHLFHKKCDLL